MRTCQESVLKIRSYQIKRTQNPYLNGIGYL